MIGSLDLTGKTYLITGIITKSSLAYGIAQVLKSAGATLIFSYQHNSLEAHLRGILGNDATLIKCDVDSDQDIQSLKRNITSLDGILHSITGANLDSFGLSYVDLINRKDWLTALNTSAYSLTALTKELYPVINPGGSIITLTYLGGEYVVPGYNIMGIAKAALESTVRYLAADMGKHKIRVNAISAGPFRTFATSASPVIGKAIKHYDYVCPIGYNTETMSSEAIGNVALFLVSNLASTITGQVIYADNGYSIMEKY